MNAQSNHFVGTETTSATTSAPTSAGDGFDLLRGTKELWVYIFGTSAPSGFTADFIPWVFVNVNPTPSADNKVWIALAKVVSIPLDGEEATNTTGQALLIDLQGNIAERFYAQYSALGAPLRGTYYGGAPG